MISIFTDPLTRGLFADAEVCAPWEARMQVRHYLAFEAALARALEASGRVGAGKGAQAAKVIAAFEPDMERLAAGMARDGVPIPDLVAQLRAACGGAAGAVHAGATSQDVMDTALAFTLREVNAALGRRLETLGPAIDGLSARFGKNALMGRTRMQAALPITVGDRIATWRTPLREHGAALVPLRPRVERLQLGGPVGTRAEFGEAADAIAAHMADALGLAEPGHAWHTDRSALAEYAGWLARLTGTLGKMGQDVALMAQQGLDEAALAAGGGSSVMAHKNNPVLAELLVTLARYNAAQVAAMHGALVHEQERSGAAWMLEWMVLPGMTAAAARACGAAAELCGQITRLGTPSGWG